MFKLTLNRVLFFSQNDEENFFNWLKTMNFINDVHGELDNIVISCSIPNDNELRDLLAIYERYRIDPKELSILLNDKNKNWFYDRKMYWFEKIWQ